MNTILTDGAHRNALLPFTYTRPVGAIRIGILTIKEKWDKWLNTSCSYSTETYLAKKFPILSQDKNLIINASFLPNAELVASIKELKLGEAILFNNDVIAHVATDDNTEFVASAYTTKPYTGEVITVKNTWDIFSKNAEALASDFALLTKGRKSQPIPESNTVSAPENIFLEEGAKVACSILNATSGPIYIGKNAEIMEGSMVRGALALCENAVLKMGAKIYGASTFGPYCKVGGEVSNCIFFGYSNKGHDGFMGNSVLGEWCNIGADTNTSNLKNNYAQVRLWSYETEGFAKTGLQFCGLMMGDHSKCGIDTMFNTGTVVGVSANIFGSGFPRNFVPSYSWGGASGFTEYKTNKAFETATAMMGRRKIVFDATEQAILEAVFEQTIKWRNY